MGSGHLYSLYSLYSDGFLMLFDLKVQNALAEGPKGHRCEGRLRAEGFSFLRRPGSWRMPSRASFWRPIRRRSFFQVLLT